MVLKSSVVAHRVGEAREGPFWTEEVKLLRTMEIREILLRGNLKAERSHS